MLQENDKIVSNAEDVAALFNEYFANVAKGIGSSVATNNKIHPSLRGIFGHYDSD